ncbi:MAG: NusG domain II-containing protein [Clostridia bacterium]|nr:NusG domain II-containing protein [Clostridia bacterium]
MVTIFKKSDILVAAIIITVSVLLILAFLPGGSPEKTAVIRSDSGETVVDLDKEGGGTVVSAGHMLEYSVRNGSISVVNCTCRDKICVRAHAISRSGQTIICMPAHVAISIKGGAVNEKSDIVAG